METLQKHVVCAPLRQTNRVARSFHHTWRPGIRQAECVVHTFEGGPDPHALSMLYVPGSQKHIRFFEVFRKLYCSQELLPVTQVTHNKPITWFHAFSIDKVNTVLMQLRQPTIQTKPIQELRLRLTQAEIDALPLRFEIHSLPMQFHWVAVWDAALLRAYGQETGDVTRWKVFYTLHDVPFCDLPNWPLAEHARQFELRHTLEAKTLWPWCMERPVVDPRVPETALIAEDGIVLHKLNETVLEPLVSAVEPWIRNLMGWPKDVPSMRQPWLRQLHEHPEEYKLSPQHLYRNPKQFQSKHIPRIHGRTLYGHTCPILMDLFRSITPFVSLCLHHLWPDQTEVWVVTADVAVQFGGGCVSRVKRPRSE
jgi:hypothetical protein